jgi:hypothetical protein
MYSPVQDIPMNLRQSFPINGGTTSSRINSFFGDREVFVRPHERTAHMPTWSTGTASLFTETDVWSAGTASLFTETDVWLRLIESLYGFKDRNAVREFVHIHSDLAGLLVEAYDPLIEAFGPSQKVQLSVVRDPEIDDRVGLFGAILTRLTAADAMTRLEKFDEIWFLRQLKQLKGLLTFDLEFI